MNKSNFSLDDKKPEIEINKRTESKFWQRPNFNLVLYLLIMFVSFYLWQGYTQGRNAEIPYSDFLQHVEKKEVKEAIITDKYITGTLTIEGSETHKPRRFITIPLQDTELAEKLEKQGVTYTVRHSSNWLGNFIANWVLPLGLLFLLWTWIAKRMGSMGKGFLNVGNKVHIHPDSLPKITLTMWPAWKRPNWNSRKAWIFSKTRTVFSGLGAICQKVCPCWQKTMRSRRWMTSAP